MNGKIASLPIRDKTIHDFFHFSLGQFATSFCHPFATSFSWRNGHDYNFKKLIYFLPNIRFISSTFEDPLGKRILRTS